MGQLAAQALARVPELGEWIEPSLLERRGWPAWREALASGASRSLPQRGAGRLAYDEIFANQLALLLLRQSAGAARARRSGRRRPVCGKC
jgi:ATP-dependent DNA helicase RecG